MGIVSKEKNRQNCWNFENKMKTWSILQMNLVRALDLENLNLAINKVETVQGVQENGWLASRYFSANCRLSFQKLHRNKTR
jgi:hypothetical protein